MIGAVGDDDRGAMLAATLERRGVGSAVVRRGGVDTGTAIIQLDAAGENSIVILEGANGTVGPEDATAALAPCREGDVVVAQLEIPQDAIAAGFAVAREQGARTILNAAPAADASALLPLVDVLVVNETEAEMLLGERAEDPARRLHELHGCDVVVTLGGQGSVVLDADGSEAVPAIPTDVVDTTGAGDAFVGAAAAALAAGASLRDAARAGTRLAHEVCGVAGAQGYGG
ncbi:PfkB family carbohydrate kinase [Brachybacterium nesterenkovii]|uniref:PfkB family carbohydrate kinase n=1 Tax=Brachybacterium nesterenkovii TaxID=47847 RepID=UPI003219EA74